MPRAVWTGSLAFGLVSIPIALYPATRSKDVRFHLVDPETGRRVRYRRVVELPADDRSEAPVVAAHDAEGDEPGAPLVATHEVEVEYGRLARAYEIERDRYAIVQQDEIERIRPSRSSAIDIEHFVRLDDIDPVYFEKSYHLVPRRDADRPYSILRHALGSTGLAGIGRFVLRTKPHLVAIRPTRGVLGLETLYFADEVSEPEPVALDQPTAREIQLAEQLVEVLAEEWEPSRYGDEYRAELLRLIERKAPEELEPDEPFHASPSSKVDEMMAALKQSVEDAKRRRAGDAT